MDPEPAVPGAALVVPESQCSHCPQTFRTARGLAIHTARCHAQRPPAPAPVAAPPPPPEQAASGSRGARDELCSSLREGTAREEGRDSRVDEDQDHDPEREAFMRRKFKEVTEASSAVVKCFASEYLEWCMINLSSYFDSPEPTISQLTLPAWPKIYFVIGHSSLEDAVAISKEAATRRKHPDEPLVDDVVHKNLHADGQPEVRAALEHGMRCVTHALRGRLQELRARGVQ